MRRNQYIAWKLTPGSDEARVVELLRFLPRGTELRTSELFARLEMKRYTGLPKRLQPAVERGLLQREKRRVPGRPSQTYFWMAGDAPARHESAT